MSENKSPRILRVTWTNDDEWTGGPRVFQAWVSETAVKAWTDGLRATDSWDIQVGS